MADERDLIEHICGNTAIRREFLWLRAMEKEDETTARDLERVEPGLRERMAELVDDFVMRGGRLDSDGWRRNGYAELYHERMAHHELQLMGKNRWFLAAAAGVQASR